MTLKKLISSAEDIPLSIGDLKCLLCDKGNVIIYEDLINYDNIIDAMGEHNRLIVLYNLKGGIGHFVSLFRIDNVIYFYNSYGLKPDAEIDMFVHPLPILTNMLLQSKFIVKTNIYKHQEFKEHINTCGRHAVIRCLKNDMDHNEYNDWLKSMKMKPDELVSLMTISVNL